MAIVLSRHDYSTGPGLLSGSRHRHLRAIMIAGVVLIVVWTLKSTGLFRDHYTSGFDLVDPSELEPSPTPTAAPGGEFQGPPKPITLTGDNFYLSDALHGALHPPPPPPPPPREFPASVAVIMESNPAAVTNLVPVMLHFANVLGPEWPVVLLTLRANWVEPASPAFRRLMAQRRIHIFFLPDDTVFPDHTSVSKFLTRPWIWERFESADRVLLFQADSVLCSSSERRVEDFAEYDLIGAPIHPAYGVGYNGGLSLRNPKAMLDVIRDPTIRPFDVRVDEIAAELHRIGETQGPDARREAETKIPSWEKFEDQWFYTMLKQRSERISAGGDSGPGADAENKGEGGIKNKIRLPTTEVAKQFAVETVWNTQPLGYHQPFRWLTPAQKTAAITWCPEVAMLQDGSHFF